MGWMRHHGIVVTSWDRPLLLTAHGKACQVFPEGHITEPTEKQTNGYSSFLVAPDGSKEGWEESDEGDCRRREFIDWLRTQVHEDGSSNLDWIEYSHDADNNTAVIVTASEWQPDQTEERK